MGFRKFVKKATKQLRPKSIKKAHGKIADKAIGSVIKKGEKVFGAGKKIAKAKHGAAKQAGKAVGKARDSAVTARKKAVKAAGKAVKGRTAAKKTGDGIFGKRKTNTRVRKPLLGKDGAGVAGSDKRKKYMKDQKKKGISFTKGRAK